MRQSQVIPLLIYVALVLAYLWFSTKFEKGLGQEERFC